MSRDAQPNVLVIDDEADLRELLSITLGRMNINAHTADSVSAALSALKEQTFDLCLTDMNLPDGTGEEIVMHIHKQYPNLPVAVITAYGNMETATNCMKHGAYDFIAKPISLDKIKALVDDGLGIGREPQKSGSSIELIGDSASIADLREQIVKLSRSQAPIYISGESGTGKEMVARLIHQSGPRKTQPFVAVNCGAIPSELMESEFFGHRKGSFTGAYEDRKGLFREANGGTLFLDEVADLPLHMQVKLLRAIQEKSVRPIGESKEFSVNVRVLSATHKNLASEVENGNFRQDLFYRLNVIESSVPPLRDRSEDIPLLTKHILSRLCSSWEVEVPAMDKSAIDALNHYSYPGNVRELENILERALTLSDNQTITSEHLQIKQNPQAKTNNQPRPTTASTVSVPANGTSTNAATRPDDMPLEDYLQEIEQQELLKTLNETHWNRTAAAKKLGMTFRSLRYRLKKLGIDQGEDND
jgi:two-component system response regulator PilR (NtrC family)